MSIQNVADCESEALLQQSSESSKKTCMHPTHWYYRYIILGFVCFVKTALNCVFDAPASLEDTIIQTMKIDVAQYNLLYAVYCWPTIVTTFLAGILVDRFIGLRLGAVLFVAIASLGQLVFTLGSMFNSFPTMIVGRFFCGIGCDSAFAVTDALAAVWFRGKELTFMNAMLGFGCRLGGTITLFSNQFIYEHLGFIRNNHMRLGTTLMVAFGLSFLCILSTLILYYIDKRGERILKREITTRSPFRLKDIREFGGAFWLATISMIAFYSSFFPFVDIAQVFFIRKYRVSVNNVSILEALIYLASLVCPITGVIINWTGYNLYWGLGGLLVMLSVHLLFLLSNGVILYPYIGNVLLGFSHSLYNTSMWAAPAYLVSERQIGTAFGICSSLNNLGNALTDLISGYLIDGHGYFAEELLFVCYISVGILALLLMIFLLAGENHPVNISSCERKRLQKCTSSESQIVSDQKKNTSYGSL